ncbi:MAG: NADH-quinone oxidoreductase subunit NuoK [Acidobacteriota bacterium]|nr:NADH-quinone oxidoreductase subunit NuoK [Acidobacteriota bacterium]OQB57869.1 MAG: NADH-quinone oxidoreductase subunit K [Candidatus Aminicenantes bacterium ADurb.Bin147]HOY98278.1 NADH-quinone oxidoreductase subunit NuoK [Candidatus Aminicenantes bacterium]MDD8009571.1 NADH-quinone oxidoreductase subunit NuoK [Acidobacteriota bacterium]MDD8028790.1 NADH-quinone oxidoreductase subunit NuoK [Acidobacteriota bacterium]
MSPAAVVGLSLVLFVLGVIAFFVKRDLLTQFMAVEIMLNAANLAFLGLARGSARIDAQVIVFFVMTVAAAEAAVGLAIILHLYRRRKSIRTDELDKLRG